MKHGPEQSRSATTTPSHQSLVTSHSSHDAFALDRWFSGGEVTLYAFTHMSEFFPHAVLHRAGPVAELPVEATEDPVVADAPVTTRIGEMTLRCVRPASRKRGGWCDRRAWRADYLRGVSADAAVGQAPADVGFQVVRLDADRDPGGARAVDIDQAGTRRTCRNCAAPAGRGSPSATCRTWPPASTRASTIPTRSATRPTRTTTTRPAWAPIPADQHSPVDLRLHRRAAAAPARRRGVRVHLGGHLRARLGLRAGDRADLQRSALARNLVARSGRRRMG